MHLPLPFYHSIKIAQENSSSVHKDTGRVLSLIHISRLCLVSRTRVRRILPSHVCTTSLLSLIHIYENGNVVLGDEMLTPDSSRFWPLEGYEPGHSQPSFDKQFVRDWLKANPDSNYDLPQDVIDKTIAKYLEAYELLTGKKL